MTTAHIKDHAEMVRRLDQNREDAELEATSDECAREMRCLAHAGHAATGLDLVDVSLPCIERIRELTVKVLGAREWVLTGGDGERFRAWADGGDDPGIVELIKAAGRVKMADIVQCTSPDAQRVREDVRRRRTRRRR